jgi:pimeloyl-ACP methyl ester carboxylesterase
VNLFERHVSSRAVDYAWAYRVRAGMLRRHDPRQFLGGDGRPVVLLPGVYETWHFLEAAAAHLNVLGHPVHAIPSFGRNLLPIGEMAALAGEYLEKQKLEDVLLVAHSKGGLIGKSLMLNGGERINSLVAINTPFGGSDYAHLVPIKTLREFVPTHETIRSLAANAEVNSRITSVYSTWDPIVPNGSELDGATNIQLPVTGHFRILDRPELLEILARLAARA